MGDGADVGAGADAGAEVDASFWQDVQLEFVHRDGDWCELDILLTTGEFVGGHTMDFLGGKWRRNLFDGAEKAGSGFPHPIFVNFSSEIGAGLSFFL